MSAERLWLAPVFQNLLLPSYRILFHAYNLKKPLGIYFSTERVAQNSKMSGVFLAQNFEIRQQ